jgi:hypothetical protein
LQATEKLDPTRPLCEIEAEQLATEAPLIETQVPAKHGPDAEKQFPAAKAVVTDKQLPFDENSFTEIDPELTKGPLIAKEPDVDTVPPIKTLEDKCDSDETNNLSCKQRGPLTLQARPTAVSEYTDIVLPGTAFPETEKIPETEKSCSVCMIPFTRMSLPQQALSATFIEPDTFTSLSTKTSSVIETYDLIIVDPETC